MKEPLWIEESDAFAFQERALAEFGGAEGVRDHALLQSALARPKHIFACAESPTLHEMAAAYIAGLVQNHPFVDGNKRTAFLVGILFLELNGYRFTASEEAAAQAVIDVAAGRLDEASLTDFLTDNSTPDRSSPRR